MCINALKYNLSSENITTLAFHYEERLISEASTNIFIQYCDIGIIAQSLSEVFENILQYYSTKFIATNTSYIYAQHAQEGIKIKSIGIMIECFAPRVSNRV